MIKKTVKAIGISLAVLSVMVAGVFVYQATASAAEERSYVSNNGSNESVIDEVKVTDTTEETTVIEETTTAPAEETTTTTTTNNTTTGTRNQTSGGQANTTAQAPAQTQPATQAPVVSTAPQAGVLLTDAQGIALASQNSSIYASQINEMYSIINQRRAENGLGALQLNGALVQVASFRAAEMAHLDNGTSQVSHTRPNGTSFSTVARNIYGVGYSVIGENVCDVISSASGAMTAFMNSPGHQANILGNYTNVGIGVAQASDGTFYWVQIFTL